MTWKKYKSYSFTNQDPVVEKVKAVMRREGLNASQLSRASGVSGGTIGNWIHKKTKRPQYAAVMAVLRGAGYDMKLVKKKDK